MAICGALDGDFRIEPPLLDASTGINRDHLVEGRAKDQAAFNEERCPLELRPRHILWIASRKVAGAELPGANEAVHIGGSDLPQGREPRASTIPAPLLPCSSR